MNIRLTHTISNIFDYSNINLDNNLFNENITTKHNHFVFNPYFLRKTKNNKLLLLNTEFFIEKKPVSYRLIEINNSAPLNIEATNNEINQKIINSKIEHILKLKTNKIAYDISIGSLFEKQIFYSNLYKDINYSIVTNYFTYQFFNNYFKSNLNLNLKKLEINTAFKIENTFFNSEIFKTNKTYFDINIDFIKNINKKQLIYFNIKHNKKPIEFQYLIPNYILNSYNVYSKGLINFDLLDTSSLTLSYNSSAWLKKSHINTSFNYQFNNKFISYKSLIDSNKTIINYMILDNKNSYSYNFNIDHFFNIISSRLKYKFVFTETKTSNFINESDIRNLKSKNLINGIEVKSGFLGFFNFNTGYELILNSINSNNKNTILMNRNFLNLEFTFSPKIYLDINCERISYFDNNNSKNNLFLIDSKIQLKLKKASFFIYGTNLLNNNYFHLQSINDNSTFIRDYQILPRYLLIMLKIPIK